MTDDYLRYTADVVRQHADRLRADGDRAPVVHAFLRIGEATCARCYADQVGEALVIVSCDDQSQQATYAGGLWREASVYDADGALLYVLSPHEAIVPVQRPCSTCGKAAWFMCQRADGTQEFHCSAEHVTLVTAASA